MNKVLICLILIAFIFQPSKAREEESQKNTYNEKYVLECIFNNKEISPQLKKYIEENKEDPLVETYLLRDVKLEAKDHIVISECKKKYFKYLNELMGQGIGQDDLDDDDYDDDL